VLHIGNGTGISVGDKVVCKVNSFTSTNFLATSNNPLIIYCHLLLLKISLYVVIYLSFITF
jgi:hypothetical protein